VGGIYLGEASDNSQGSNSNILNLEGFVKEVVTYGRRYHCSKTIVSHINITMADETKYTIGRPYHNSVRQESEISRISNCGIIDKMQCKVRWEFDEIVIYTTKRTIKPPLTELSQKAPPHVDTNLNLTLFKETFPSFADNIQLRHSSIPQGASLSLCVASQKMIAERALYALCQINRC